MALLCSAGQSAAQKFNSRSVNVPGSSNVFVTGVNDSGTLVVNFTDTVGTSHCVSVAGTTVTPIADPNEFGTGGGTGTSCWGINNAGQIAGWYSTASFDRGFSYSGGVYTDVAVPTATGGTAAYGLNGAGDIVGSFADSVGQHGFLYTASDGSYQTLDVPNAFATLAIGINDNRTVTFEWVNAGIMYTGAVLKNGKYTNLTVPGTIQSKARGINVHGWIDLSAQDASGVWHGYLYRDGKYTQFDVAGAANTYGFGINSNGLLVGGFDTPATTGQLSVALESGFEGRFH